MPDFRIINSRHLAPGHIVIFDDGTEGIVATAKFGPDLIGGPNLKSAHVFEVTFSTGLLVRVHPGTPVKVKGARDQLARQGERSGIIGAEIYIFPKRLIDGPKSSWFALLVKTVAGFRRPTSEEAADYVSRDTW